MKPGFSAQPSTGAAMAALAPERCSPWEVMYRQQCEELGSVYRKSHW